MKAYWKRAYSYWSDQKHSPAQLTDPSRMLDGGLRDSALRKLLLNRYSTIDQNFDFSTRRIEHSIMMDGPVDLSSKRSPSSLVKFLPDSNSASDSDYQAGPRLTPTHIVQENMSKEMERLRDDPFLNGTLDSQTTNWKCSYCPYTAPNAKVLHSHYQFHQQLLTSHSSKPHMEWLAAYKRGQENSLEQPLSATTKPRQASKQDNLVPLSVSLTPPLSRPYSPMDERSQRTEPDAITPSLSSPPSPHPAQSASGFLRAIVQAVMTQRGQPSKVQSSTRSIYASLLTKQTHYGVLENKKSPVKMDTDVEFDCNNMACPASDAKYASTTYDKYSDPMPQLPIKQLRGSFKRKLGLPAQGSDSKYGIYQPELMANLRCKEVETTLSDASTTMAASPNSRVSDGQSSNVTPTTSSPTAAASSTDAGPLPPQENNLIVNGDLTSQSRGISSESELSDSDVTAVNGIRSSGSVSVSRASFESEQTSNCVRPCSPSASNPEVPTTICDHCGINFDDAVLHSIHMGCHSRNDPFECNLCGKSCGNKYAFYTHFMRGHHDT